MVEERFREAGNDYLARRRHIGEMFTSTDAAFIDHRAVDVFPGALYLLEHGCERRHCDVDTGVGMKSPEPVELFERNRREFSRGRSVRVPILQREEYAAVRGVLDDVAARNEEGSDAFFNSASECDRGAGSHASRRGDLHAKNR